MAVKMNRVEFIEHLSLVETNYSVLVQAWYYTLLSSFYSPSSERNDRSKVGYWSQTIQISSEHIRVLLPELLRYQSCLILSDFLNAPG